MMIIALIFTMLIELAVLLLLRERRPLVLGSSVVINILTNVPLNLFVAHVDGDLVAKLSYYAVIRHYCNSTPSA